jgi:hypothetical protein
MRAVLPVAVFMVAADSEDAVNTERNKIVTRVA